MATRAVHPERGMLAVDGQGIYFYYGRKKNTSILRNVNIAVKRGSIYGLLGPSGCGKTTLLKCITGQHKPQRGSLKIFGKCLGTKDVFIPGPGVGYMPQEIALYMDMSVEEILTYFGTLYGMTMKRISKEIAFLVEFLDLPNKKRLIKNLSGGQQRRVSFAVALIHKPPLLILDEPTVGVDPLLRQSIWNHLVSLATKDHLTVIITTHYTEEARQSHTVSLMRNGHVLVERNPEFLIKHYGGFTLEDVFLKLCRKNRNEDGDLETNIDELIPDKNLDPECLLTNGTMLEERTDESCENMLKFAKTSDGIFHQSNIHHDNSIALLPQPHLPIEFQNENFSAPAFCSLLFYLTRKNLLRMKRNYLVAISLTVLCCFEMSIFFVCFSSEPNDLQVAVVNEESQDGLNKYGERFLQTINNHTISQKPFRNFTLARESLQKGESPAVLHIGPEFSTCLVDRALEGIDASNDTIVCSRVTLILDMSNYVIAATIAKNVFETFQVFLKDLFVFLGKEPLVAELPLVVEKYMDASQPGSYADFLGPAVMLLTIYIMAIAVTEMSIIQEKKEGLLARALVAGATTTEILLSFFLSLLILIFLEIVAVLVVSFCAFNILCVGQFVWVLIACILTGISAMAYGFLISSITDNENVATIIGIGSVFSLIILSAALWPIEAMPYYLRYVSYSLPLTRIIQTTRSVMVRGWSITDNNIWDGYLITSFWTVLLGVLASIVLKFRK